ncbi:MULTISPECIES: CsgG/HfaB family protein [Vibrio harveyi group]|jgi:curli biogenesis system outer membrane secretion channel CsgG|uniref:CsgG/HfaB family protein n=1 Tax=Vibrio TaxID=662 RepID=UPI0005EFDA3B|nr:MULTISPECIES: CsgG/HfaB family protein [Vibrio harveyi group]NOJ19701.1 curli production assembly protein CsgG [Vibrio jasicida]
MKFKIAAVTMFAAFVSGCATQSPQIKSTESSHSQAEQLQAQKQAVENSSQSPTLKRKVALGRISNETIYGKSLLRDEKGDVLGKQVTDMLSKALTESGQYMVFERPDIERLKDEAKLTGEELNIVGVDTLIIGSLTEFGRKTEGESGFLSSTKKQVAYAKVDLRLVDSKTGLVYHSLSGAGESSSESASVAGFGSKSSYDGTLNDSAISNAISDAISKLTAEIQTRPWTTDILAVEDGMIYISGGESQGIKSGMTFNVETQGKQVKSKQTGFDITLPGKKVAEIEIVQTFGDTETNEGAIAVVNSGSIANFDINSLNVVEQK